MTVSKHFYDKLTHFMSLFPRPPPRSVAQGLLGAAINKRYRAEKLVAAESILCCLVTVVATFAGGHSAKRSFLLCNVIGHRYSYSICV